MNCAIGMLLLMIDLSAVRRVDSHTPDDVQVALAKAAGPAVSDAATIYVIGSKGYRVAQTGTNGFTCLVERERPDTIEPECYDREGSETTLQVRLYVETQRALGIAEERIEAEIAEGYKSGRFTAPRRPGIVYMMSNYNYVFDPDSKQVIHFPGHLMFYAPYLTEKDIGSGPGAPFIVHPGHPDSVIIVIPAAPHSH
jgi:hypothetical protein